MIDDTLLNKAFLAALPMCLQVSGWTGRDGGEIRSIDSRVRLAWDVAVTACQMHPTRPGNAAAMAVPAADAAD